jgi:hypothetical protein
MSDLKLAKKGGSSNKLPVKKVLVINANMCYTLDSLYIPELLLLVLAAEEDAFWKPK